MTKLRLLTICALVAAVLLPVVGCREENTKKAKAPILKITSVPTGADIIVKGKKKGKTPFEVATPAKKYLIKFEKEGHFPVWKLVDVKAGQVNLANANLKVISAPVLIVSNPAGAKVKIEGVVKGETPLVLYSQTLGKHSAIIDKHGFTNREAVWDVKDGRPIEVRVNLSSNIGKAVIVSVPPRAILYIDGKQCGYTPYRGDLEEGLHKIRVEKHGYTGLNDVINIKRNETSTKKLPMKLMPGKLIVNTSPGSAEVFINGRTYGSSPVTAEDLQPGSYRVRAAKPGFDSVDKPVEVAPGATSRINLELSRNTGGIDMLVEPPGATLYINGKKVGSVKAGEEGISDLFKVRGLQGGDYVITVAHKRAVPTQKRIRIKVIKGRVTRPKPVRLWVANAEIKELEGKVMTGIIIERGKKSILFSPEPGVKYEIDRNKLEYVKDLKETDD